MARGFTLLELVITISVCGVVLAFSAPSFNTMIEGNKMKRLATEFNGFLIQGKSEAVMRNTKLFAHFSFLEGDVYSGLDWTVILADSDDLTTANKIAYFDGSPYQGISLLHTYSSEQISFDEIRGRPKSGSLSFYPTSDSSIQLSIKTSNPPGRIRVCSLNGEQYGYQSC
ncbi:GspH/FimT family pseudopilin [Vibrio sp. 10N.261.55.A7]|uniref:pilus assembly FimT family protein n=1 Tax=Vibrio sp. 10N.261.55.A7 TaxID=1880851 RepID=UPI000C8490F6|nr:GspH/FimT family pseudopilin [Vibrio sp. 10N.261.55.A7]PMJ88487.1 type IV pilin [Vibrio sp. 10N.261.55.A7]